MAKAIGGDVSTPVEVLISYLNRINTGEFEVVVQDEYIYSNPAATSDEDNNTLITSLAEDALIAEGGRCNWDNIALVKAAGFSVYAGEKDSFGWLTGCIDTKKGTIVYG